MADISVVIVNFNTTDHLFRCMNSLITYNYDFVKEIIVVDNNSSNRNIEELIPTFPQVKFVLNNTNFGFGAGCNLGAKIASGRFLLFVNPDVEFCENVNKALIDYMEKNPDVGLISTVYNEFNKIIYTNCDFPGYNSEIFESLSITLSHYFPNFSNVKNVNVTEPFEVNWVMGSFMLIKTELFNQLNGFDENFFLYYEDIDLQYRMKQLGYKIIYHPDFIIHHLARSSVRSFNGENLYFFHMTRSKMIYMYKHLDFIQRNICRFSQIAGIILRVLYLPFNKKYINKKRQKIFQFYLKMKLFLSFKNYIYNKKYYKIEWASDNMKNQIISNDEFWQS